VGKEKTYLALDFIPSRSHSSSRWETVNINLARGISILSIRFSEERCEQARILFNIIDFAYSSAPPPFPSGWTYQCDILWFRIRSGHCWDYIPSRKKPLGWEDLARFYK
jgi:hypothetical protein